MEKFNIDFDINDPALGLDNSFSIPVKVKGFWSSDSIRIYVRRDFKLTASAATWEVSVNRSAGGRDEKELACDIEANRNYAAALEAACDLAADIQMRAPVFEERYRAERDRLKAEAEARIAADPELGEKGAKEVVELLASSAKLRGRAYASCRRRGDAQRWVVVAEKTPAGRIQFFSASGPYIRDKSDALNYIRGKSNVLKRLKTLSADVSFDSDNDEGQA